MKYTKEESDALVERYVTLGQTPKEIAEALDVPERSVIAKLSSLGVYKSKQYLNKRGEVPRKKEEVLEQIALLLGVPIDQVESLEKANKNVLLLLENRLGSQKQT